MVFIPFLFDFFDFVVVFNPEAHAVLEEELVGALPHLGQLLLGVDVKPLKAAEHPGHFLRQVGVVEEESKGVREVLLQRCEAGEDLTLQQQVRKICIVLHRGLAGCR